MNQTEKRKINNINRTESNQNSLKLGQALKNPVLDIWDCGDCDDSIGTILVYWKRFIERLLLSVNLYHSREIKSPQVA